MKISEIKIKDVDNTVNKAGAIQAAEETTEPIQATSIECDLCGHGFNPDEIVAKDEYGIRIVYYDCPECQTRHNFMFEDKAVRKAKAKIKLANTILHQAELEVEKETLRAKNEYYSRAYEELLDDEKALVGEYVPYMTKELYKELSDNEKAFKYGIRDLLKLL